MKNLLKFTGVIITLMITINSENDCLNDALNDVADLEFSKLLKANIFVIKLNS